MNRFHGQAAPAPLRRPGNQCTVGGTANISIGSGANRFPNLLGSRQTSRNHRHQDQPVDQGRAGPGGADDYTIIALSQDLHHVREMVADPGPGMRSRTIERSDHIGCSDWITIVEPGSGTQPKTCPAIIQPFP